MRIQGPGRVAPSAPQGGRARASSGTFTLSAPSVMPHGRASACSVQGAESLAALLAMQDIGFQPDEKLSEKRKRSVKSGRHALDILDDLKQDLLSGRPVAAMTSQLNTISIELKAICDETQGDNDPMLDQILSDIALRVEIELEKTRRV